MANRLDPRYGHQPATNTWLRLNDEMLQEAAHNVGVWRSYVAEFVRCAQLLDTSDPFGDCFICASTFRAALNDGEQTATAINSMGPSLPPFTSLHQLDGRASLPLHS